MKPSGKAWDHETVEFHATGSDRQPTELDLYSVQYYILAQSG